MRIFIAITVSGVERKRRAIAFEPGFGVLDPAADQGALLGEGLLDESFEPDRRQLQEAEVAAMGAQHPEGEGGIVAAEFEHSLGHLALAQLLEPERAHPAVAEMRAFFQQKTLIADGYKPPFKP